MKGLFVFVALLSAVCALDDYPTECPAEQETNWEIEQLLRHEDCHKFYKCTFGQPIEYRCYGDLYFNLETWQCDWPHNVDCTGRNDPALTTVTEPETTTTTTTAAPTTTSTTTTTTPAATTTTSTTTTTTPAPTTTTSTTTTTTPAPTTTTSTTTTTTPAPTTTSTTTTTTTPAPTTTTSTTTTTPAPTTTSTTTTSTTTAAPSTIPECIIVTDGPDSGEDSNSNEDSDSDENTDGGDIEFLPNGCPVNPRLHWLLPHETECNLFYYCVWGEKVLRDCPATLHFNPTLQVCDWSWDAGCTVSANKHAAVRRQLLNQILS